MICPVEIASDLSAFLAARVRDHAKHGFLLEGRDGAGDESAGTDLTGHGEEDNLVCTADRTCAAARRVSRDGDGLPPGNRHLASNPEQQPIGESAFPEIVQKSRCGKSAGPTWSLPCHARPRKHLRLPPRQNT